MKEAAREVVAARETVVVVKARVVAMHTEALAQVEALERHKGWGHREVEMAMVTAAMAAAMAAATAAKMARVTAAAAAAAMAAAAAAKVVKVAKVTAQMAARAVEEKVGAAAKVGATRELDMVSVE